VLKGVNLLGKNITGGMSGILRWVDGREKGLVREG